jgi:Rne/Rng family ribonuclease
MQDILINWTPQETRVAVVENGAVQELHIERALERGLVGNIYAGKVVRVLPGMQSAFIDIGLERAAFLHVADVQVAGVVPRRMTAEQRDEQRVVVVPVVADGGEEGVERVVHGGPASHYRANGARRDAPCD